MTRVKGGAVSKNRRRKVLKEAKGYFGSKHRLYKTAQEQVFHSGTYAFRDRRNNKRNFRKLWITRINAACELNDMSYSRFIDGLNKAGVEVNRKMLSELAIDNPKAFSDLVLIAKKALSGEIVKPVKADTKKVEKTAKAEKVEEKKEVKAEVADLDSLSVAALKELAKEKGIKGITAMKKADLINALK